MACQKSRPIFFKIVVVSRGVNRYLQFRFIGFRQNLFGVPLHGKGPPAS